MVNKFVLALAVVVCCVAAINAACCDPCYGHDACIQPYNPCCGNGVGYGCGNCGAPIGGCGTCGTCGGLGNCGHCGGPVGGCGTCGNCGKVNYKSPQKNFAMGNSANKNPSSASSVNTLENNVNVKQNHKNANRAVNRNRNRNLQNQNAKQAQQNKNNNVNNNGKKPACVC